MPQSLSSLTFHVIFSTRHRRPLIPVETAGRLYGFIGTILRSQGNRLLLAGGMPDHLHLLVSLSRNTPIASTVRDIKANSCRWFRQHHGHGKNSIWQRGYAAFSVSFSDTERVRSYIRNQEQHHRKMTFEEELLRLLRRHDLEFDERYLWD